MTARVVSLIALSATLAACGSEDQRVLFDGLYFRTSSDKIGEDRANFSVLVRDAALSVDAAREAGRYEGTVYCIENYGTSRILWSLGPDSEQLAVRDGDLTLQGRCTP